MIQQTYPDNSVELASALQQALTKDKRAAVMSLMSERLSKTKAKQLMAAVEAGQTLGFELVDAGSKHGAVRYEVIIDFTKNEVHVTMRNNERTLVAKDFKVLE